MPNKKLEQPYGIVKLYNSILWMLPKLSTIHFFESKTQIKLKKTIVQYCEEYKKAK